jgi:hypothetical protein
MVLKIEEAEKAYPTSMKIGVKEENRSSWKGKAKDLEVHSDKNNAVILMMVFKFEKHGDWKFVFDLLDAGLQLTSQPDILRITHMLRVVS